MAEGGAADDDYLYSDDLFLEKPPENYSCPICLCPVQRGPHLTSCCGNHFCLQCIRRVKSQGVACPMCNATPFVIFPNKERQREINQLRVRCPCQDKHPGCSWTGKLGKIDSHVGEHNGRSGSNQIVSQDTSTRETITSYHQPHSNEPAVHELARVREQSGTEDGNPSRCVSTSSAVTQQNTYHESQPTGNGYSTTQSSETTFFLTPFAQHHPAQPIRLHFHQPLLHHCVPASAWSHHDHRPHPPPHHRPHSPPHHGPHHPPHHGPHHPPHHVPHHPPHHVPHHPPHHRPHPPPHHVPHSPPHHGPHHPPHHVPHHPPHHVPHHPPHHRPHSPPHHVPHLPPHHVPHHPPHHRPHSPSHHMSHLPPHHRRHPQH